MPRKNVRRDETPAPQGGSRRSEVKLFVKRARLKGAHGALQGVCTFRLRLPDGGQTPGLPHEAAEAYVYMDRDPDCGKLRLVMEVGPYDMTCRGLPEGSAQAIAATLLRKVAWRKLQLLREEDGVEMEFEGSVAIDSVTGPWMLEALGTEIFVTLRLTQPLLE